MKKNHIKNGLLALTTITLVILLSAYFTEKKQKEEVSNSYAELADDFSELTTENTSLNEKREALSKEIEEKNDKINFYMGEIENKDLTIKELKKYKGKVAKLNKELDQLIDDMKALDVKYIALSNEHTLVLEENDNLKAQVDSMEIAQIETAKRIVESKRPYVVSINAETYKERRNNNLVATDRARRIDIMNVCVDLVANEYNLKDQSDIFLQIIKPDLSILDPKTGYQKDQKQINYTGKVTLAELKDSSNFCSEVIIPEDEKLKKGKYLINVYDVNGLIAREYINLK